MLFSCRSCQHPLRPTEIRSLAGSALFLTPTDAFIERQEAAEEAGEELPLLPFYLDAHPCFACGEAMLSVVDLQPLLEHGAAAQAFSSVRCPACAQPCRGPWRVEGDGVPDGPVAFLGAKLGAPLSAHLCIACGRVVLALDAADGEGRRELSERFPDGGRCDRCEGGHLRLTHVDVPYSGRAALFEPPAPGAARGARPAPITLTAAVCDACGEASLRVDPGEGQL
jgi:hypothetical protein